MSATSVWSYSARSGALPAKTKPMLLSPTLAEAARQA
jgi:hypothetical protein